MTCVNIARISPIYKKAGPAQVKFVRGLLYAKISSSIMISFDQLRMLFIFLTHSI